MQVTPLEARRFYAIWKPLLWFVNEQRKLVSPSRLKAGLPLEDLCLVRDTLWAEDTLIELFALENPAGLPSEDLALVKSWRHHRVSGKFFVVRHLKKHSIFIGAGKKGEADCVYAVLGLESTLDELTPNLPCLVDAVLLPFEDRIIYDSMLIKHHISFGAGIRRNLDKSYMRAKEAGNIIQNLLPQAIEKREADRVGVLV